MFTRVEENFSDFSPLGWIEQWEVPNLLAIKWADFSPLRTRRGSAWTSGGPLADPPGVLFAPTLADLLRTPKESAADPKIRSGFAADPPQVRGGAVDFLVSKKTEKVRQSAK